MAIAFNFTVVLDNNYFHRISNMGLDIVGSVGDQRIFRFPSGTLSRQYLVEEDPEATTEGQITVIRDYVIINGPIEKGLYDFVITGLFVGFNPVSRELVFSEPESTGLVEVIQACKSFQLTWNT